MTKVVVHFSPLPCELPLHAADEDADRGQRTAVSSSAASGRTSAERPDQQLTAVRVPSSAVLVRSSSASPDGSTPVALA